MSDRLRVCYLWRAVSCPLSLRRRNRESAKRKSAGSCVRNRVSGLFRLENSVGAGSGQTAGTGRARNRGSRLIPIGVLKLIFAEADEFVVIAAVVNPGEIRALRNLIVLKVEEGPQKSAASDEKERHKANAITPFFPLDPGRLRRRKLNNNTAISVI
ncbi:hypothetical protein MTP99_011583 [Tenebrio molitor]|nr:hypothetical protein MTP99_011583 [Tenebrio molitor]